MPVVPTEQNKVGIAGVTGAKLEAGDFSGSGLQAIGSGLKQVGGGLDELEKAQEAEDDAAIKRAYNRYAEAVRPLVYEGNDAVAEKQGGDAVAMAPIATQRVYDAAEAAAAGLKNRLQSSFRATMAPRIDQDVRWIQQRADAATKVSQSQQSDQIIGNCKRDAIAQHNSFAFVPTVATGLKQIGEQVAAGTLSPEAGEAKKQDYLSGIHLGVITGLATSDPVLGAGLLEQQRSGMLPAHHLEASQALQGPLGQARGIADVDALGFAQSPVAPETPPGDIAATARRMLAITPEGAAAPGSGAADGAGAAGSAARSAVIVQPGSPPAPTGTLPALLQHYGGDAAKAWAAWRLGDGPVDTLVAAHGDTWFGALPKGERDAVGADMALLRAAISPRVAPPPADRAAAAARIDAQPWIDERKRNAHQELRTRIGLADQRLSDAQKGAADRSFRLSDSLRRNFISINQIPPADRLALDDDARAALMLRADRNVHPVTVPPHGDVAMDLNRMAATDPQAFAKQDLRLFRDRMSQAEYEALGRVQQAWSGYPPAPAGITQQRTVERVRASGLDVDPAQDASQGVMPQDAGMLDRPSDETASPSSGDVGTAAKGDAQMHPDVNGAMRAIESAVNANENDPAEDRVPSYSAASVQPAVFAENPRSLPLVFNDGVWRGNNADVLPAGLKAVNGKASPEPKQGSVPTGKGPHQHGIYSIGNKLYAGNLHVRSPEDQAYNRRLVEADFNNARLMAYLTMVAVTEGPARPGHHQFNELYGGKYNKDLSRFPYADTISDATGMFQIQGTPYDEIGLAKLGVNGFSPRTQTMIAMFMLRKNGLREDILSGDIEKAIMKGAGTWSSLPPTRTSTESKYPKSGTNHNQPAVTLKEALSIYNQALGVWTRKLATKP